MQEVSATVVNNVVTMFAVVIVTYAAMYIVEKMIHFAVEAFNGLKTPTGWLRSIRFRGEGLGKQVDKL